MSNEWTASRLGDHLREPIRNGYSPGAPDRPTGKWQLTLAALTPLGFDPLGVKYAPADDLRLDQSLLSPGDILVSRSNTPDRVGLAGIYSGDPTPCSYPDLMMKVRLRESLDTSYCAYLLLSSEGRRYFSENARGSSGSMVKIDRSILQAFPLRLPSQSEQKAISRVLGDVDSLLASLECLLEKKRDLKRAAMQQLLTGRVRLPSFAAKWKRTRLGEVLKVRHGRSQQGIESPDGAFPILATGGEIGRTNSWLYDKPSVLIGRKGTINKPQYRDEPFWTVDTLFYTELADEVVPKFIYFLFSSIDWLSHNEASGVPSLNATTIEAIEVSIPDYLEQHAIAHVISEIDAEIETHEQRRQKTVGLKLAMMQQLLTGRIRLI